MAGRQTAGKSHAILALVALLASLLTVFISPSPAQAIGGERAAILFPYANGGKTWLSGHGPATHPVYFSNYGYSTDLHAAEDTAVQARFQSSDGNVTLKVVDLGILEDANGNPCNPSAGSYVTVEVKVDSIFVGKVIYEHLENVQVTDEQTIPVGQTLGNLNLWGQSSCWADTLVDGVVHSHLEVQKGCYRDLAAWTNYSSTTAVGLLSSDYAVTDESRIVCDEADVTAVMSTTPGGPGGGARLLAIDAGDAAWANDNLGMNGWNPQTNPGTTKAIAAGGNRVAVINTLNEVWVKDGIQNSGWNQVTPSNTTAVAVGSNGLMMVIDSCGAAWANPNLSLQGWTPQTGCNDTRAIAVGGSRSMFINGCGAAYAKDAGGPYLNISGCNTTKAIAVGANNRMILINSCDAAWASDSITTGWTQVAPCDNVKAVAAGGWRLVLLNVAGEIWASDSINSGWTQATPTGNTVAIAAGSNGRIAAIDACGGMWAEDTIGLNNWSQGTPCGNTKKIAVG